MHPRRLIVMASLLLAPSHALAQPPAAPLFDPHQPPLTLFQNEAPAPRFNPRFKVEVNPAPFARKYLDQPDLAPSEPRDAPFNLRGDREVDGPNTKALWQPNRDLDLSATMRLTPRTNLMLGFSPSARGRFTPAEPGNPRVVFLQLGRRW